MFSSYKIAATILWVEWFDLKRAKILSWRNVNLVLLCVLPFADDPDYCLLDNNYSLVYQ